MQAKVTGHFGYEKYSTKGDNSENSRNGNYEKTLKGPNSAPWLLATALSSTEVQLCTSHMVHHNFKNISFSCILTENKACLIPIPVGV